MKNLNTEHYSGVDEVFSLKLSRVYAPILKALGKVTFPYQLAKISKVTGLQEHVCKQRIQSLLRNGWRFTIHVNELKLGLKRLVIILKRRPDKMLLDYLRSASRIIASPKYMLSYYIPISRDPLDVVNYYGDLVEDYYVLTGFDRTRPDGILKYYDLEKELISVKYSEIIEVLNKEYHGPTLTSSTGKSVFGGIDLVLIKELQKNPFMTYKELSDRTKLSYSRILRRMKLLVREGVLGSIRIMRTPKVYQFIGIVVIEDMKPYMELMEKLLSLPYVGAITYSDSIITIALRLPWSAVTILSDIVEVLDGVYDVKVFLIDPRTVKSYTIPYRQEYSKYEGWVFKVTSVGGKG